MCVILFIGLKDSQENNYDQKVQFTNGGLDVTDLFVSDDKFSWSLIEVNSRSKQTPNSLYFTHTHIDLERIFNYATEQIIKRIDSKATFVSLYKCQVCLLTLLFVTKTQ